MIHYNPNNDPRTLCFRAREHVLPEEETPTGTPVFEFRWCLAPQEKRDAESWEQALRVSAPTQEEAWDVFRTYQEKHPQAFVDLRCGLSDSIETVLDYVCVEDFCGSMGRSIPISYWADYWFSRQCVVFGGLWERVPDMPSDTRPSEEDVHLWADSHPNDLTDLRNGITPAYPPEEKE